MVNYLLIIVVFLSVTFCSCTAAVNADADISKERLEKTQATHDADHSTPVKVEKTDTQEIEQSEDTQENQLITEIDKGKGTLLMVVMREGYIYPAELQMDGVLESYPLKTKVVDYHTSSLLMVTLNRLILFKEIVNENYHMEFIDDSKWFPLTSFRWNEEEKSFLGQIDSAPTWQKYSLSKIRFKKKENEK